jgi:hypothetical protein
MLDIHSVILPIKGVAKISRGRLPNFHFGGKIFTAVEKSRVYATWLVVIV